MNTKTTEQMIMIGITFLLITWTCSLIFVMNKLNNEINYITDMTYYHSSVLETIKEDLEPISQFKGLTKYRTFSCIIGDGQIYYD